MEKKTYSLWNHIRYFMGYFHKYEGYMIYPVAILYIVCSVLNSFLGMAFASAAVKWLTIEKAGKALTIILGYVLLLQVVEMGESLGMEKIYGKFFLYRVSFSREFAKHCLTMDYQAMESVEGQKKQEAARRNIWSGNEDGMEPVLRNIPILLKNVIGLVLYGTLVGSQNIYLLVYLFVTALVMCFLTGKNAKRHTRILEEENKKWKKYSYLCEEITNVKNEKDIHMYHASDWFINSMKKLQGEIMYFVHKARIGYFGVDICQLLFAGIRDGVAYGYFILQMMHGNITLPELLLYLGVVAGFSGWMEQIFESIRTMMENKPIMDNYRDFIEFGMEDTTGKTGKIASGSKHEIRLEHVSFTYPGKEEPSIDDVSLTISPQEKIALVGMNGAGKSTLIKLICGLYQPQKGKIYMDGVDVTTIPKEHYFEEFSVVFQEVFSFAFSLADNVTCQVPEEQEKDRMITCLKQAGLMERVERMPKGLETVLGKELSRKGVLLSGGEMQKLMLARALYRNAPIVILDEPTAALDPIAESRMYEKYYSFTKDKMSIFISHRLSSTRFCDRILFLQDGRIVEEGSHESLMKQQGAYAEMFQVQAHYYQEEEVLA
ncbi:ABC transporter ATP-binding protein [Roseburia sp. MSJ-14]|uniref:ABC transporter ATP-binding protein n=1 Tax=Roseburia sp. MSJ-14 TaxID=2841514 RepID=UPI001C10B105|nr:ABC transporter ATP-binding protein [Roseburia sp. MSJ-14]MBU5473437.1 ABC transporter ATP-binding protein/permease [Roseburia sp. MSJ-14]